MDISEYLADCDKNRVISSEVPIVCKTSSCVLGIDEAGRGPVLGPMVYGVVYCPVDKNEDLKALGVEDSKALSEEQREKLLEKLFDSSDFVGWTIHFLTPKYISTEMNRRSKYNLNQMSHDTAIGLIQKTIDSGVRVASVYVDTVGPPDKYQTKLEQIFPELNITVSKKADSLFACVSAASICAKIARDKAVSQWKFTEKDPNFTKQWGSGYPGDPVTKKFLRENLNFVFGFPSLIRFSWKTTENILKENCCKLTFEEIEPEEDPNLAKNPSVKNYFVAQKKQKCETGTGVKIRNIYFRSRGLTSLECM